MEVDITVNYKTPADEFEKLGEMYSLGEYSEVPDYDEGTATKWFSLRIKHGGGEDAVLKIVWFRGDDDE